MIVLGRKFLPGDLVLGLVDRPVRRGAAALDRRCIIVVKEKDDDCWYTVLSHRRGFHKVIFSENASYDVLRSA